MDPIFDIAVIGVIVGWVVLGVYFSKAASWTKRDSLS